MIETITITKTEYSTLIKDSYELSLLKEAGVDNWGGYEEALRIKESNEIEKQA